MKKTLIVSTLILASAACFAQNPIITTSYTPDPAPYVHGDKLYMFTGHDEDDATYFKMNDWQVFSTEDMVNWTYLGTPISTETFKWAFHGDRAWASQAIERNGKWYWYVDTTKWRLLGTNEEHPEQVSPSYANGNVYIDEFSVSQRYPNFEMYIEKATAWWNAYVLTGNSPVFDEKKDAEILKALRTNTVDTTDLIYLFSTAEKLKAEIEEVTSTIVTKEKELKTILEEIKKLALVQFREGDTKVSMKGDKYEWVLSKTTSTEIDKSSLEADGLLEKYTKSKINYRLTTSEIKED